MRASGLPRRHLANAADALHGEGWMRAMAKARPALARGETVVLCGDKGRGKTQMAVALASQMAGQRHSVAYVKAMDLFRDLREAMQNNSESARVKHYTRRGFLIVDDAHERGDTDYETRSMVNLLDHRYDAMKPTLLITNQTPGEFAKSVGRSIVSRIQEAGLVLLCEWTSYRGAA